jgi:amino acid transporter
MVEKVKELVFGKAKDPLDQNVFHKLSLIAFLAWVGLGADGLSSSAYGPEETYKALGAQYHHIALYLAIAVAATVFIISASYSQVIEHFPSGGGGYVVASKLLHPVAGLISGSALIVDYILTINISIAAGVDAIGDFMPAFFVSHKLSVEVLLVILLIWLNMRGIKESVQALLPIFLVFVGTHIILIGAGLIGHGAQIVPVVQSTFHETHEIVGGPLGLWGFIVIFFTAYSLGGGTYTGIEAVSNGLANLREPRVQTGKRTMLYMATSLAFTAGGILLLYMLWDIQAVKDETMNGTLSKAIFGPWTAFGLPVGRWLVTLTLLSEGMLLFIAAQTGFIDGPNVLSNMAVDSWLPHRFANLSHRLVRMNGVLVMGVSTLVILILAKGNVDTLIVLYAINVYITFSLSQLSMCVHWWQARKEQKDWIHRFFINGLGLALTSIILAATVMAKFLEGGFVTIALTTALIAVCFLIKRHYRGVQQALTRLDDALTNLPLPDRDASEPALGPCDKRKPVAVVMVERFNGLGIHAIFSIQKLFANRFQDFLFVSIGRIDSSKFKGAEELDNLRKNTAENLRKYVALAHKMGYRADFRQVEDIDVISGMEKLCDLVAGEFPDATFFSGKLIFAKETLWTNLLHNQTALEIQRRLLFKGVNMVIVPVRVL